MSWSAAVSYCAADGGQLATFKAQKEFTDIWEIHRRRIIHANKQHSLILGLAWKINT